MHLRLALVFLSLALAAAEPVPITNAEDAARLAVERNALMRARGNEVAAANWRAREALAFVAPQIDAAGTAGIAEGTRNNAFEAGLGRRSRYAAEGTITQYLFGFGRALAAKRGGRSLIDLAQADSAATRRDLAFRARVGYADVLFARALVAIAEARLEQRRSEREDVSARKDQGVADGLDLTDAELRMVNVAEQLELVRSNELIALEALAEVLDLPSSMLRVEGDLERVADLADLVGRAPAAVANGADLARLDAIARRSDAEVTGSEAQRLPLVSAFAGGDLTGDHPEDLDDGWSAGLRLDWTVFDGGGDRAGAYAAREEAQAIRHQAEAVIRNRAATAAILLQRSGELDRRIAAKREAQVLAETLYREVRERYNAGTEPLLRVNEANLAATEAAFSVADLIHEEVLLAAEVIRFLESD